jgi:serine/threonine protein kinase/tetratricopeptide (TPR) repeat protein
MSPETPSVESIFAHAIEIQSSDERVAYLDRTCAHDSALRGEVERLVRDYFRAGEFLENPLAQIGPTIDHPVSEAPGTVIGPYKLLQQIGEGGMGTVYLAEQTHPVRRRVALKVIKGANDNRQVLARFEAERQAVALMDHPNIAKVLDAGATPNGRPYFVMELVKGVPITQFCDQQRLTPKQRLELFVPVCQAVQHAHQKGIIHRDLKPSNVLVCTFDGRAVPKIIDFGVAKATGPKLTERTLFTEFGAIVGTFEYMSPEQAQLDQFDIDTRSDIYSLGVLLYELLTGSTPLERKWLREVAVLELLRLVREQDPPRPSTRLSTTEGLPSIAANRGTEPKKLRVLMRGELDWIVLKALEKDRDRRYATAIGLAQDIERFLHDEPVFACPPSAAYRLQKFARKHRKTLMAGAAFVVVLVAATIVSVGQAVRATRAAEAERRAKLAEADRAEGERGARLQAQKRLAQVEKNHEIIASIFTDLDLVDVKEGTEPLEAVLAQRLLKAANDLEGDDVGDPLAVAALQNRLGISLCNLGFARESIGLFAKARVTRQTLLGNDHPDTVTTMSNLGSSYKTTGQLDLAVPLIDETLALQKARLGRNHPDTLVSMGILASAYQDAGKLDLALPLYQETLELMNAGLAPDDPAKLTLINDLATAYRAAGKLELALPLLTDTLALRMARLGTDHLATLDSMNNLARAYQDAGKLDLALPLLEETVTHQTARLGRDHPRTLTGMNNLALAYQDAGKLDLALPLFKETLDLMNAKLGRDDRATLSCRNNLALAYRALGKLDLALPLFKETLELRKLKLGADHPGTLLSMCNLALAYQEAGMPELALPLLNDALSMQKSTLGADHPDTLMALNNLASAYKDAGKLDQALPLMRESLALVKTKLGPDHPATLVGMNNLAMAYKDSRRLDQSLPLLE